MADIYYKIDGSNIYYCNEQKSGYTLRAAQSEISENKNVIIELYNEKFVLPVNATKLFWKATNTSFDYMADGDTSECTDMFAMFAYCSRCISMEFTNWNTHNVTDMASMFGGMTAITELNLTSFDGYNVSSTTAMFALDTNLTTIYAAEGTDLNTKGSSGEMPGVNISTSGNMFQNCTKLPGFNSSMVDKSRANNTGNRYGDGYFKIGVILKKYKVLIKDSSGIEYSLYTKDSDQWKEADVYCLGEE